MAFRLEKNESLADGIKRVGIERLESAASELKKEEDKEKSIHSTRKKFKEIRALLRLIRDPIGEERYQDENAFFRDAGREFAGLRDNTVILEMLEALQTHVREESLKEGFQHIITSFAADQEQQLHRLTEEEGLMKKMYQWVQEGKDHILNWPIEGDHFDLIRAGMQRVYKRGYQAINQAYQAPSIDNFHELRKRTKYLWLQTAFLCNLWPEILEAYANQYHLLSDILGNDHDMGLVIESVENDKLPIPSGDMKKTIQKTAEAERKKLEGQAYPVLLKAYAEKPSSFIQRISTIWHAWKKYS